MRFNIITIFPNIFDSYLNESLVRRAREKHIIDIRTYDLRSFSTNRHKKVDDKAFGGGPGMVLQIEPIYKAVQHVRSGIKDKKSKVRTILFSTRGKKLDARAARRLSKYDELIFICGRYEGVDERVAEHIAEEELSIGDYVLSGGELPALVTLEAISRFVPRFLGKHESLEEIKGSYPVYTRPPEFLPHMKKRGRKQRAKPWRVPAVLLSGNHKKIATWRMGKSKRGNKK